MDFLCPLDHPWSSLCLSGKAFYLLVPFVNHDKKGEKLWRICGFFFKILHVRGRNTSLCKGEMCSILLRGVLTSLFLYTGLVTMFTYIVLIFDIYDDVCLLHLPLHVLFRFYLYAHASYILYTIYYFCLTLRCFDEFCLKCFRNTGC